MEKFPSPSKSFALILLFLFLIQPLNSFVINKYLLPGEKAVNTDSFSFLYGFDNYTVYTLNDSWILLTLRGKVVEDPNQIREALSFYLKETYFLTEEEINDMRELILEINASRNNGDKFEGYEELTCRGILGERYNKPSNWQEVYNNDLYYFYSVATCSKFGQAIGCGAPEDIYDDIKSFFVASYENDDLINSLLSSLEELSFENAEEKLNEMVELLDDLDDNREVLENSKFRVPIGGSGECGECFGICPPVLYNSSAIQSLSDKINAALNRVDQIRNLNQKIETLIEETQRRVNFKEGKELEKVFAPSIEKALTSYYEKIDFIKEVDNKVKGTNLSNSIERLEELFLSLNDTLYSYNFTNISERLTEFNKLLTSSYELAIQNNERYKEVEKIKERVEFYIEVLGEDGFEDLLVDKKQVDVAFEKGVPLSQLSEFGEAYSGFLEVVMREKARREQSIGAILTSLTKGWMIPFSNGITTTLSAFGIEALEPQTVPLITSVLLSLFIFSIVFFLALFVYSKKKEILGISLSKGYFKFVYFGLVLMIGLIFIVAGLLSYFLIKNSLVTSNPEVVLQKIISNGEVRIAIDKSSLSFLKERIACANEITDSLERRGKVVKLYDLVNGLCVNEEEETYCLNEPTPLIILKSGTELSFKGEELGFLRFYFIGSEEDFKKCVVSSVI